MLEALPVEPSVGLGGAAAPEKPPSKLVPLVIGGVGVASLVGSGVLFVLRQGTISDLEAACGAEGKKCPPSQQSTYDDLKFYHYGAQITLGVGVAALGTAGALLFFQRKKRPEPAADGSALRLVPSLPLSSGRPLGATLHGRF